MTARLEARMRALFGTVLLLFCQESIWAQAVPPLINYQGKLLSSNGLPLSTGDYELRFRIWDAATNGNLVWGPQVFNGQSGLGFGPLVPVVQGWFNVILGPVDTNGIALSEVFGDPNRFLEVRLGDSPAPVARQAVLSAPFAFGSIWAERAIRATTAESADFAKAVSGQRTTNSIVLHVSTDGSDENDGLSREKAKRTIQAAITMVPDRIEHPVDISIWPGAYSEAVEIRHKVVINPSRAFLRLKGMGANPGDVRISGIREDGSGLRTGVFYIEASDVALFNLSIVDTADFGVSAAYRANLSMLRVKVENIPGNAITVNSFSYGSLEDVVIEKSGSRGSIGVAVESMSSVGFRNDHAIGAGENGVPAINGEAADATINTIRNYGSGVRLYFSSSASGTQSGINFVDVLETIAKHATETVSDP